MERLWEDEDRYWREAHASRPYASGVTYEVLWPGYRYGYEAADQYAGREWPEIESDLAAGWEQCPYRGESTWEQVKNAVRDGWDRVVEAGRSMAGAETTSGGDAAFTALDDFADEYWVFDVDERSSVARDTTAVLAGVAVGAALSMLLDPVSGRRRRAHVRDKIGKVARRTRHGLDVAGRDMANRARGVAAEARRAVAGEEPGDRVLEERVRAELGRLVSHPGAIHVTADDGTVTLHGAVLASEESALTSGAASVPGVKGVVNMLSIHETPEGAPSLQARGARAMRRVDVLQANWAPATRLLFGSAGSALALYGFSRRDTAGWAVGTAGALLAARAATNAGGQLVSRMD
jgi:osmotically-inducible protein OsmY